MTSRPSTAAPILAALAIVLATLGAYVGGYLWLGEECEERWDVNDSDGIEVHSFSGITRVFPQQWHVALFQPAAQIESCARRIEVETTDMRSWVLTRER